MKPNHRPTERFDVDVARRFGFAVSNGPKAPRPARPGRARSQWRAAVGMWAVVEKRGNTRNGRLVRAKKWTRTDWRPVANMKPTLRAMGIRKINGKWTGVSK